MNTKDYNAVCPAITLSLEALRKASEGALKAYDFLPLHPKVVLYLLDRLEAAKLEAATMRSALEEIASGEIIREHCHGPHCTEELGIATADEMSSRAAGALSFIDAAMAATKGEQ